VGDAEQSPAVLREKFQSFMKFNPAVASSTYGPFTSVEIAGDFSAFEHESARTRPSEFL